MLAIPFSLCLNPCDYISRVFLQAPACPSPRVLGHLIYLNPAQHAVAGQVLVPAFIPLHMLNRFCLRMWDRAALQVLVTCVALVLVCLLPAVWMCCCEGGWQLIHTCLAKAPDDCACLCDQVITHPLPCAPPSEWMSWVQFRHMRLPCVISAHSLSLTSSPVGHHIFLNTLNTTHCRLHPQLQ